MRKNIAITIRSFGIDPMMFGKLTQNFNVIYRNETDRRLSEDELSAAVSNAHGVIAGTELFSEHVIRGSKNLEVISRVGVGTDNIDMRAAIEKGVEVMNTPVAPADAVAEHTIALMLDCLKNISLHNAAARQKTIQSVPGLLLKGKTTGIIGLGRIGFRVGELLSCMGCSVCYYDPFIATVHPASWNKMQSLHELLANADIITLHAPAQKDNSPIMDREAFNQCRHGVLLINTARGSLVDESALLKAIKTGKVAGAGLDVTNKEPYEGPLLAFPQVILTPHVASNTIESRNAMEMESVKNLIRGLEG